MFDALQIVDWFIVKHNVEMLDDDGIDPMTQMKIHKLLYYAQGVYLAYTNGEKLFKDDLLAWQHGPVVRSVYDKFVGKRDLNVEIDEDMTTNYNEVSDEEKAYQVLETVYKVYGDYSAGQLRNMTHDERPWKETQINEVIPNSLIQEYFTEEVLE
ncbi:Panacea domain-containing protein [Carnobacterium maltaromaticum]|uniref:Panacea domain-containing protein n=1 Tax=Carnobacterium maltaromaticum TaxID=2751 RepID=UPI001E44A2FD|nr:type II toxin-antitoxin system antitoxin SocA domain-containing protein [Carnobacterium maltaromaticum]